MHFKENRVQFQLKYTTNTKMCTLLHMYSLVKSPYPRHLLVMYMQYINSLIWFQVVNCQLVNLK